MRAGAGHGPRGLAVGRVDGVDKPELPDRDVNETRCRVEERDIGRAADRPDVTSPEALLIPTRVASSQAT